MKRLFLALLFTMTTLALSAQFDFHFSPGINVYGGGLVGYDIHFGAGSDPSLIGIDGLSALKVGLDLGFTGISTDGLSNFSFVTAIRSGFHIPLFSQLSVLPGALVGFTFGSSSDGSLSGGTASFLLQPQVDVLYELIENLDLGLTLGYKMAIYDGYYEGSIPMALTAIYRLDLGVSESSSESEVEAQ